MQPIRHAVLPKMTVQARYPRGAVFATKKYCGINVRHPYWSQCIAHLSIYLEEMGTTSNLHNLLYATVQDLKVKAGFNPNEGRWDMAIASVYVTPTWMTSLVSSLKDRQVFKIDTVSDLHTYTDRDLFLMDQFIHAGYQGKNLRIVNYCQMHLKVFTISDIWDMSRLYMEPWALKGTINEDRQHTVITMLALSASHSLPMVEYMENCTSCLDLHRRISLEDKIRHWSLDVNHLN